MAVVVGPVIGLGLSVTVGFGLTTLFNKGLEGVKLLAEGDDKFLVLQNLLSRLQEHTAYLEDKEGEAVGHEWLASLREELARAEILVIEWQRIKPWYNLIWRWNKQKLVKRLISVTENLQRLDHSQIASWASNVRNFDRLGGGVDRLGDGVDRVGEEVVQVKTSIENLTSEMRSLTEERKELVRATKRALSNDDRATSSAIEEITRKALGTSGSVSNLELDPHFNIQSSFPDEVFGGNDIVDKVIEEILDGDYRKCVGLWNMGGAGKTFTAGRVYHDSRIQNYFDGTRHRIWVTVSRRSTYSVMEEIFKKLGGDRFPAANDEDGYAVKRALKGLLDRDKFLLVIDDVWGIDQLEFLDWISEPKDSKRRVILVTTRDDSILRRKHATKIEVPLLSVDDSWKLFSRYAFGRGQVSNHLRGVSRSVAAECKGLPLALKVIGSTLAGETNLKMWRNALKKLQHPSVLSKEHEEHVFGILQLSVDNLRDRDDSDSRLQQGFFYFAAYPEDAQVDPRELVYLWTAEGIVGKDRGSPISPEDEAYELLGTLIALSMIEVAIDNKAYSRFPQFPKCKIHDVMRDLALYNLETNFGKNFSETEKYNPETDFGKKSSVTTMKIPACERLCLYRPGVVSYTLPEDWTISEKADVTSSATFFVERISLMFSGLMELPEQFDAPHLRSLLLGGNYTLQSLPNGFFQNFKALEILDLQLTAIEEIPEAVFDLISLVLLNLNRCHDLRQIPASIAHLQNLQQLRLHDCSRLRYIPRSLRSLKSLKVLEADLTDVWDGNDTHPDDTYIRDERNYSREDVATFQDVVLVKTLQSLSITSKSLTQVSEISGLTALQSLELDCRTLKELPGSFTKLINLKSLRLRTGFEFTWLPALDQLPDLEELYLECKLLESFPDSFFRGGAFPSLQSFFTDSFMLKAPIRFNIGAMPQIKSFTIRSSLKFKQLPTSFQVLKSLVYLEVSQCPLLEGLLAFDEPNSFPDLKEVNFTGTRLLRNLPAGMLKSAPNLRKILLSRSIESGIPEDLLEKKRLKQLEIVFLRYLPGQGFSTRD